MKSPFLFVLSVRFSRFLRFLRFILLAPFAFLYFLGTNLHRTFYAWNIVSPFHAPLFYL